VIRYQNQVLIVPVEDQAAENVICIILTSFPKSPKTFYQKYRSFTNIFLNPK
jgi:hypothetical protein